MARAGSHADAIRQLAQEATHTATERLRALHADEYAALRREERVARGLPEEPVVGAVAALRSRVAELEAELAERRHTRK